MTAQELIHFLQQAHNYESKTQKLRNRVINPNASKTAAVLLAIVQKEQQWQILLTRRSDTLRQHTGQISLAGGRVEPYDANLTQTALRETYEETGIAPKLWQIFPALSSYYTPSGYEVYPIPALCCYSPNTHPNPNEVSEIFYLPLDFVMNLDNYSSRLLHHQGSTITTPTLPFRHYDIWGLTAIILYSLAERYQQHQKGS